MTNQEFPSSDADYAKLEKLVAKIQQDLAPTSIVEHNVKLMGKSGHRRQIDVLVRDRIGQYEILIVIDCKDYKSPVDIKGVEEFAGLYEDVGAQKGVLVCPSGFTKAAKARAQQLQIDLYSPIDTDPHKWQARVRIPATCRLRSAAMSFGVSTRGDDFRLKQDFFRSHMVFDLTETPVGFLASKAIDRWNSGDIQLGVGRHEKVDVFGAEVLIDNGMGLRCPVTLWADIEVSEKLYFGQYMLEKFSGFKDEIGDRIIANAFEVGLLSAAEVLERWKVLDRIEDAPVRPVIAFVGFMEWPTDLTLMADTKPAFVENAVLA